MPSESITTVEALFDALDDLTTQAKRGNLANPVVSLLFDTMDRLMRIDPALRNRGLTDLTRDNQRQNHRITFLGKGQIIHQNQYARVEIIDMSSQGFGVKTPRVLPVQSNVMFEINSAEGGKDTYSCYVQNCQFDGENYRVGLKIFDMIPCF
ncbi:MAG: PilZ domain-containing protein [Magnetococcales bacterium]|nr:PilZ domain-containing protein [Magnetococcales bacterium]